VLLFDGDVFAAAVMIAVMEKKNSHRPGASKRFGIREISTLAPGARLLMWPSRSLIRMTFHWGGIGKLKVRRVLGFQTIQPW
jgi:hypothetical protein